MKTKILFVTLLLAIQHVNAEQKSLIDVKKFTKVSTQALKLRAQRMLSSEEFLRAMRDKQVIILDTRSKAAFNKKHLKGAVHLTFADFTDKSLAKVLSSKKHKILIYCNNNILGDNRNFMAKRVAVALNHQTFINLYAYGYKNVFEMAALVNVNDKRFIFEGSDVVKK